jgi:hypothetical protein
MLYGVNHEANVDVRRIATLFVLEFSGIRSTDFGAPTSPQFVEDRSVLGSGLGGGNYTPGPLSPIIGRTRRGNTDRDVFGATRLTNGAAGAIELPPSLALETSASFAFLDAAELVRARSLEASGSFAFTQSSVLAPSMVSGLEGSGSLTFSSEATLTSAAISYEASVQFIFSSAGSLSLEHSCFLDMTGSSGAFLDVPGQPC